MSTDIEPVDTGSDTVENLCVICEQPLGPEEEGAHYGCWAAESAWGEMLSEEA
jgi:hypothetical protein